jgi:putative CocE/NonD family hydrolase
VLLTQTPYGAGLDAIANAGSAGLVGASAYLVARGYIGVEMDVRGTGASDGTFGLFDPVQAQDGALITHWAAKLPHANGEVGLFGPSYLGIDQFRTAVDAGPGSPIKAMFPIVSSTELYRDIVTAGGVPQIEFNLPYELALVPSLNLVNPILEAGPTLVSALTRHLAALLTIAVPQIANIASGGSEAYDGPYWQVRSPVSYLRQIVADKIPAFLVGGWFDLFQRGEPLNYSGFQNAYRRRPVLASMRPHQPVTGRYQLIDGPVYHATTGSVSYRGLDLNGLELAWFDRWLKGIKTGIDQTSTPLHVYDLGTNTYREASRYPFDQAKPTTYYFNAGGALSPGRPTTSGGSDSILFAGASIGCSNSTEQWSAGLISLALGFLKLKNPCITDASLSQIGPWTVNYTTPPFTTPTTLAGPIGATIYAKANTRDTLWVVSISDVGPDGKSRQITQGVLDGSLRALNMTNTWMGAGGRPILPYHPYTKASQTPVVPGQITRYDVEIFPTFDTLLPGHRLRVTVASDDFPHIIPSASEFANLLLGSWQVQRNATAASGVELPLATPSAFASTRASTPR